VFDLELPSAKISTDNDEQSTAIIPKHHDGEAEDFNFVANRPRFGGNSQAHSWYRPWCETQLGRNQLEWFSWTRTSYVGRDRYSTERVF
jgi:hypothetical protein